MQKFLSNLGHYSAKVEPNQDNNNRMLGLRLYKYILLCIVGFFIIFLIFDLFFLLSSDDKTIIGKEDIKHISPERIGSLARKTRISRLIWTSLMLVLKAVTFVAVSWEKYNFVIIIQLMQIFAIIYDALIAAFFSFIFDVFLMILLIVYIYKLYREKKHYCS